MAARAVVGTPAVPSPVRAVTPNPGTRAPAGRAIPVVLAGPVVLVTPVARVGLLTLVARVGLLTLAPRVVLVIPVPLAPWCPW